MKHTVSGLMSPDQARALSEAMKKAATDPNYLSSISGEGPVVEFEQAFANAVGAKYALALSSCTAALHVALMAHGIGPGDEVIVSPYTWGQSVAPVLFTGATPVFADIDPDTCTLDPKSILEKISVNTKAIIPVHIFGIPADMDSIVAIAEKHDLAVIADAAQAFGALSKGRKLGGLGNVACYSLGRGKVVCGGEGGVLVTNSLRIYERAISLSQHPLRQFKDINNAYDNHPNELNWNYRIHPVAAVLAKEDLKFACMRIRHRKRALKGVMEGLAEFKELSVLDHYPGDDPAAYRIPLTYIGGVNIAFSREEFVIRCQKIGIPMKIGPIRVPINLRLKLKNTYKIDGICRFKPSQIIDNCPVAEHRCANQELQFMEFLSAENISAKYLIKTITKLNEL